jgi:hypothetical protein
MLPVCVVLQFCAKATDGLTSRTVRVAPGILFLRQRASHVGKIVLVRALK